MNRQLLTRALISVLALVAVVITDAFIIISFANGGEGVQHWSSVILNGAGLVGSLVLLWQAGRWYANRRGVEAEAVERTLGQLRSIAARRHSLWGGTTPAPADYWRVPWSFYSRRGVTRPSTLERLSSGYVQDLANHLLTPERTVVILGPSGAGKTTLAELIQTEGSFPARPQEGRPSPVPVYLHLSDWDPGRKDLVEWASEQILRDAARSVGPLTTSSYHLRQVLSEGRCLLLLDGLDELSEPARIEALQRLATGGVHPFVVFGERRDDELLPEMDQLSCDVVRLLPLPVAAATAHLRSFSAQCPPWDRVIAQVEGESDSDSGLATVLCRPLFLALAIQMVRDRQEPPAILFDTGAKQAEIQEMLLEAVVRAAFAADPETAVNVKVREKKEKWLRSLARIETKLQRDDLVWWDLADVTPWWVKAPLASALVFLLLRLGEVGFAAGTHVFDRGMHVTSLAGSPATFIALVTMVALATKGDQQRPDLGRIRWYRSGAVRYGMSFTASLSVLVSLGPGAGEAPLRAASLVLYVGMLNFMMALLVRWIARDAAGGSDAKKRLWWRALGFLSDHLPRVVPRQVGWASHWRKWVAAGIVGLFYGGGVLGAAVVGAEDSTTGPGLSLQIGMWQALSLGIGTFVTATLSYGVALCFGKPLAADRAYSQLAAVSSNMAFGAISVSLWTFAALGTTLIAGQATLRIYGVSAPPATIFDLPLLQLMLFACIMSVAALVFIGPIGALMTLGGRFVVSAFWLGLTRSLPLRPLAFLEWAHNLDLFRRRGFAFSFRHPRLRDTLVKQEREDC